MPVASDTFTSAPASASEAALGLAIAGESLEEGKACGADRSIVKGTPHWVPSCKGHMFSTCMSVRSRQVRVVLWLRAGRDCLLAGFLGEMLLPRNVSRLSPKFPLAGKGLPFLHCMAHILS